METDENRMAFYNLCMLFPLHLHAALLSPSLTDKRPSPPIPFDPLAVVPATDSRMDVTADTIDSTALSIAVKADTGSVLIILSTSPILRLRVFNRALISETKVDINEDRIVDEPLPETDPPNPPIDPDALPDPDADVDPRVSKIFSISVITD